MGPLKILGWHTTIHINTTGPHLDLIRLKIIWTQINLKSLEILTGEICNICVCCITCGQYCVCPSLFEMNAVNILHGGSVKCIFPAQNLQLIFRMTICTESKERYDLSLFPVQRNMGVFVAMFHRQRLSRNLRWAVMGLKAD